MTHPLGCQLKKIPSKKGLKWNMMNLKISGVNVSIFAYK